MSLIAEYNSRMIYLLLGISCFLMPYACSAVNISENAEVVATGFIGRIIYTKWCGPGNDAQHYDDLGENVEIDRCCRQHDHCNISVKSGEMKFGYRNDGPFTVSECSCDYNFRICLENTKFWVADLVASLYAFTNRKCLYNICDLKWIRCPREEKLQLKMSDSMFEGIEPADDTEALNRLIKERMANEKNEKPSEVLRAHSPVPYQQQHLQYNHNQNYQSPQNPHVLDHPLYNTVHHQRNAHSNRNHQSQYEISNQDSYPVVHPWQPESIQLSHPYQSAVSEYQSLPNQREPDTVCCVDELQLL